ncbi:methyltransferase domain-containing protein [Thermosulfuriphilus sp.]
MPNKVILHLDCRLYWKSEVANHEERYFVKANLWRDLWPTEVAKILKKAQPGNRYRFSFPPGTLIPKRDEAEIRRAAPIRFRTQKVGDIPRLGRFYPRGVFNLPGFYNADIRPTRIIKLTEEVMVLDLNHPLAGQPLELEIEVLDIIRGGEERGGRVRDWGEILTDGPGIQARFGKTPTDFGGPKAQRRADNRPDAEFYSQPQGRLPIDEKAADLILEINRRILPDGPILELFSLSESFLPEGKKITGVSPSRAAVAGNPKLEKKIIQDLNQDPRLPFEGESFEAVVLNLSLPYLLDPGKIAKEVARVLKPKGVFLLTFTDRFLAPRATELWIDLHPFERMGYALEHLLATGAFKDLNTYSARGFPRPVSDVLFPERQEADPVFAVWGRRL